MERRALRSCKSFLKTCFKRILDWMEALLLLLLIPQLHLLTWLIVKFLVQINAIPLRWISGRQRILLSLIPVTRISVLGLVYAAFFIFFFQYIIYHPWHIHIDYEKWKVTSTIEIKGMLRNARSINTPNSNHILS